MESARSPPRRKSCFVGRSPSPSLTSTGPSSPSASGPSANTAMTCGIAQLASVSPGYFSIVWPACPRLRWNTGTRPATSTSTVSALRPMEPSAWPACSRPTIRHSRTRSAGYRQELVDIDRLVRQGGQPGQSSEGMVHPTASGDHRPIRDHHRAIRAIGPTVAGYHPIGRKAGLAARMSVGRLFPYGKSVPLSGDSPVFS